MTPGHFPIQFLDSASINFGENKSVQSCQYNDIYFQNQQGLEESEYVFVKGNDLPLNWREKKRFVIAETGFGTGLNFLVTWKQWNQSRVSNQHLEFISCELHPLSLDQLIQALSPFTEISQFSKELIDKYPKSQLSGVYRLNFYHHNISLILIFSDAVEAFNNFEFQADAWYLDGFNPATNPNMWSSELFEVIAQRSQPECSLSTFTVARSVRDRLNESGFEWHKRKGFGKKREMLTAIYKGPISQPKVKQPWAPIQSSSDIKSVGILGAGIAGLTLAHFLCQKGAKVTLMDQHSSPCQEASGNPQAMVMPMLTINDSAESRFYLRAFITATAYYHADDFHADGVLQLGINDTQRFWQQRLQKQRKWPNELLQIHKEGLLYKNSGWLDTQQHKNRVMKEIEDFLQILVEKIQYQESGWSVISKEGEVLRFDSLVLANGIHSLKLLETYDLPLNARHGQISIFNEIQSLNQKHILLAEGYITPAFKGTQCVGATFDHIQRSKWYDTARPTTDHWQRQLEFWKNTDWHDTLAGISSNQSRAGIRVTTPDHMPVCGPLVDQDHFQKQYSDLHHGKHWKQYPQPDTLPNLYIFTGLGSRGYTSAPLLAEYLSNQILGETPVLESSMQQSVHPNRFLYRKLKKGL